MELLKTKIGARGDEDEEARKRFRIERLKKKQSGSKTIAPASDSAGWAQAQTLQHIAYMRDTAKDKITNQVMAEHTSSDFSLDVKSGECAFMSYLISNPYSRSEVFNVEVNDPEEHRLGGTKEFQLVHNHENNNEWKYWHKNNKCSEPQSFDMIDKNGNILLPDRTYKEY